MFNKTFGACIVAMLTLSCGSSLELANVQFSWSDSNHNKDLEVVIFTERLEIRSVKDENIPELVRLYTCPKVMSKVEAGEPYTVDKAKKYFKSWVDLWKSNDPRSGFAVFLREDPKRMIGTVMLERSSEPDRAELGYVFFLEHWGNGYAYESSLALIHEYVPKLNSLGFDLSQGYSRVDRVTRLTQIEATTNTNNIGSIKTLDKLKFKAATGPGIELIRSLTELDLTESAGDRRFSYVDEKEILRTVGIRYQQKKYFFILDLG